MHNDTVMVQTLRAYSSRLAEALIAGTISTNTNQRLSDEVTRVSMNTILRNIATLLCKVFDINPLAVAHRQVDVKANSTCDIQHQHRHSRAYCGDVSVDRNEYGHPHPSSVFFRLRTNSFLALLFRYACSGSRRSRKEENEHITMATVPAAAALAVVGMLRECVLAFETSSFIGETTVWENICGETIVFDILRAALHASQTSRQASEMTRARSGGGGGAIGVEELTHGFDALFGFVASIAEYAPQRVMTNTRNDIPVQCDINTGATTAMALMTEAFLSDAFSAILSIVFGTDATRVINAATRNAASRSAMRMKAVIVFATIARRSGFCLPADVRPYVSDTEDDADVHTVGSRICYPKKLHELIRCLHSAILTRKALLVSSALDALRGMCVDVDVADAVRRRSEIPVAVCDMLHTLTGRDHETFAMQMSAIGLLHDLCASAGGFFDAMRYAIEPISKFVCVTLCGRTHGRVWEETAALFDAMTSGNFPRSLRADEHVTLFGAQTRILEFAAFITDAHEVANTIFHVAHTVQHLLLHPNDVLFDEAVVQGLARVLIALLKATYTHRAASTSSIQFESFVKVNEIVISVCRIVQNTSLETEGGRKIGNDDDDGNGAPSIMKQLRVFLIDVVEEIVFPAVTKSFATWVPDSEGFRAAIASVALISAVIHIGREGFKSDNEGGDTNARRLSTKMLRSQWISFILRFIEAAREDEEEERRQCASEAIALAWKLLCMLVTSDLETTTALSFYEDHACAFAVSSPEAALKCISELHNDDTLGGVVDAYTRYLVKVGTLEIFYVAIKHGDEKIVTKGQLHSALASFVGTHVERLRDAFEFLPTVLSLGAWSVSIDKEGVTTRNMKANRTRTMHIPIFDSLLAQCPTCALVRIDPGSVAASVILSRTTTVSHASCRLLTCWIEHRCWRWPVTLSNIRNAVRTGSQCNASTAVETKRQASLRLPFLFILREIAQGNSEAFTCMITLLADSLTTSSSLSRGSMHTATRKLQLVYGALLWRTSRHRGQHQERAVGAVPPMVIEHTDQLLEILTALHAETTRVVNWDSVTSREEPCSRDLAGLCMVFHTVSLMFSLLELVKTSTLSHRDGHSGSTSPRTHSDMDRLVVAFLDLCRVAVPSVSRFRCTSWWPRIEHSDVGEIVDELDFVLKAFASSCALSSIRSQSYPSAPPCTDGSLMNAMLSKLQRTVISTGGSFLKSLLHRKRRSLSSLTTEEDQHRNLHSLTLLFLVLLMSWEDRSEGTAKCGDGDTSSAWSGLGGDNNNDDIVIWLSTLNALACGSKTMIDVELLTVELSTILLCSLSASFHISEHALWVLMDSTARLMSASNNSNSIVRFHTALALSRILDSETYARSFLSNNSWLLVVLHNLTREPEVCESTPASSQLPGHRIEYVFGERGFGALAWDSEASLSSALGQLALVALIDSLCMLSSSTNPIRAELDSILQSCTVPVIDVLARTASGVGGGSSCLPTRSPGHAVLEKLRELELIRNHIDCGVSRKPDTLSAPSFRKLHPSIHDAPIVVDLKRHCFADLYLFITDSMCV